MSKSRNHSHGFLGNEMLHGGFNGRFQRSHKSDFLTICDSFSFDKFVILILVKVRHQTFHKFHSLIFYFSPIITMGDKIMGATEDR